MSSTTVDHNKRTQRLLPATLSGGAYALSSAIAKLRRISPHPSPKSQSLESLHRSVWRQHSEISKQRGLVWPGSRREPRAAQMTDDAIRAAFVSRLTKILTSSARAARPGNKQQRHGVSWRKALTDSDMVEQTAGGRARVNANAWSGLAEPSWVSGPSCPMVGGRPSTPLAPSIAGVLPVKRTSSSQSRSAASAALSGSVDQSIGGRPGLRATTIRAGWGSAGANLGRGAPDLVWRLGVDDARRHALWYR